MRGIVAAVGFGCGVLLAACGDTADKTADPPSALEELHSAADRTLGTRHIHVESVLDGELFSTSDFDLVADRYHTVIADLQDVLYVDGVLYTRQLTKPDQPYRSLEVGDDDPPTTIDLLRAASRATDATWVESLVEFVLGDAAPFGFDAEQVVRARVEEGHITELKLISPEEMSTSSTRLSGFGRATNIAAPPDDQVVDAVVPEVGLCPTDGSPPPGGELCIRPG